MAEPIKLTMLGGTRTGKTCYLVGMYGMMRRGEKGFTFSAVDLDEDLVLANQWKTMRTTTGENRWPPATDQTKDHHFDFCYGYKPFRRFVWHDYRGAALHASLTDPDAQRLADRLVESSCVLLCFSAAHLSDPHGRVAAAGAAAITVSEDGEDESTRMNQLMALVSRKAQEKGRPLPAVVIVLTKFDLVAAWPDVKEAPKGTVNEAVLVKIRGQFSPLYTQGTGWTVTTCPVSLGRGLAGNVMEGKVEGINLHRPVAFAVYCAIRQTAAQAKADRLTSEAALSEARNMSGIGRWWRGVDLTFRADAVGRSQAEIDELNKQLDVLFQELITGLRIYHNGEESEFHD